jgi:hypothetical protein
MIFEVISWILVAAGACSLFYVLFTVLYNRPRHTLEDLPEFLQPLDLDKLQELLDPATEWELRRSLSKAEFKQVQRKRFWLYIQYLRKMTNNARVLIEFANETLDDSPPSVRANLVAIQQEAVSVRMYALVIAFKIHVLLFFRMQTYGWLFQLRGFSDLDGIESYERLKTNATQFFLSAPFGNIEQLVSSL